MFPKLGNRNLRKARSNGFRMTEVESKILTLDDVSVYLKGGKRTVYRLAQKGEIPAFKLGGTWRFRCSELDRGKRQQKEAGGRVSVRQIGNRITFLKEPSGGLLACQFR